MDSVPTQPAISSMASGRPSSLRQSSAIACGATSAARKSGSRSVALVMNSCTASEAAISDAPAATDGQSSGGTAQQTSPGMPSTTLLVTTSRTSGPAASRSPASSATWAAIRSAPSSSSTFGAAASAERSDSSSGLPC